MFNKKPIKHPDFNNILECDLKLAIEFNKEVEAREAIEIQDLPEEIIGNNSNDFDFVPTSISRAIALELVETAKEMGLLDYGYRRIKAKKNKINILLEFIGVI